MLLSSALPRAPGSEGFPPALTPQRTQESLPPGNEAAVPFSKVEWEPCPSSLAKICGPAAVVPEILSELHSFVS